ncbi:MAG: diacylglycerol kinase [Geobacteraceae bacterium]
MKPVRFIDSLNCAIEGIIYTARTQKQMRYHFLAALVLLLTVLFLRVSALEFALLTVSVCFVLFVELLNTGIDSCCCVLTDQLNECEIRNRFSRGKSNIGRRRQ